jgi:hypothetical protein
MTEVVPFTDNGAAARLVQWAQAASAAEALAAQLCRTAFVPETFRMVAGETEETRRDNEIRLGNATAALLLGAELGLDPIASLRALYVIRGQVAIYARMKLALLLSRGHRVWTEFESDDRIVVAGHRKDDPEHVQRVTWDVERAKRAGFTRNELYRTNPRAMLFARASSELAQRLAPDVLAGIPEDTAEELGARLSAPQDDAGGNVTVQRSPRATGAPRRALAPVPVPPDHEESAEGRRKALARAQAEKPTTAEEAPMPEPVQEETVADREQTETLPLEIPEEEPKITGAQRALLHALFRAQGWNQTAYRAFTAKMLNRELETTNELTITEAAYMIDHMQELAGEDDRTREEA